MNSGDQYLLRQCFNTGVVRIEHDAKRAKELSKLGYCDIVEYLNEAAKPHPSVIFAVALTSKGREAIGG